MKKMTLQKQSNASAQSQNDLPRLAQPAQRALAGAGVQSLEQLTRFSEAEIKALHGIGPNAVRELRRALADKGLSFAGERGNQQREKVMPKNNRKM